MRASITLDEYKDWGSFGNWRELNIEGVYLRVVLQRRGNPSVERAGDGATGNHETLRLRPRANAGSDPTVLSLRRDVPGHSAGDAHLRARIHTLEDAARDAVSPGGDADAPAAIAGAVGEALHGLLERLVEVARARFLDEAMDVAETLDALYQLASATR